jgi:signal transduction histidine kinase/GAF domain-containing protein
VKAKKHSSTVIIEESVIIERIARIVSSVRAAKPDYVGLAQELEQAVQFDVLGVVLLRYDRAAVRIAVCRREGDQWVTSFHQHPFEDSMLQRICQSEATELVLKQCPQGLDGLPSTYGDALSRYHQLRSTIIAPLVVDGRILGTLELGSIDLHTYDEQECQRVVKAVARVLASAIEGAQHGGSVAIQDRQRKALRQVSRSLASIEMDLPAILRQIVTGIAQSLSVASAIFMYDRRKQVLTLSAQAGLDEAVLEQLVCNGLPIRDTCMISQTVMRRKAYVAQDIITEEQFPISSAFFSSLSVRSVFSHPLYTENAVYGALLLCSSEAGGFTPLKQDILSLFASQATIAIHNGILLEAAHQRYRFQQLFDRLDRVFEQEETRQTNDQAAGQALSPDEQLLEELQLFKQLRIMSREVFGVNLHSLFGLISRGLLTQDELELQAALSAHRQNAVEGVSGVIEDTSGIEASDFEQSIPFVDTLSVLTQTTQSALTNAGRLGEISSLTEQLKQSGHCVNDAWFILDTNNICTYMNPAAEAFCNMHLDEMEIAYTTRRLNYPSGQGVDLPIEQVLEHVWPYVRNASEVQEYLRHVVYEATAPRDVQCVLLTEAMPVSSLSRSGYIPHVNALPGDRYYQFTCYPLYDHDKRLAAHALQVQDITQQVREKNNIDTLLSSVSHDLRTPLTTIKAATSGLLQTDISWSMQDRLEMLEDIDRETDHLTVLVSALVELSRIKMGALNLEKEWCDIREIVNGAIDKVERILSGREVLVRSPAKLPLIYVDHKQIGQVFYNLIENASRRSPEHAQIEILLQVAGENGEERLQAQVIDQGNSVPEHERQRIFESYYRLRSHGNGLGLAICKGVIEAHGGDIWVEERRPGNAASTPAGTCFIFTLPVSPFYPSPAEKTAVDASLGERDQRKKTLPQAREL